MAKRGPKKKRGRKSEKSKWVEQVEVDGRLYQLWFMRVKDHEGEDEFLIRDHKGKDVCILPEIKKHPDFYGFYYISRTGETMVYENHGGVYHKDGEITRTWSDGVYRLWPKGALMDIVE